MQIYSFVGFLGEYLFNYCEDDDLLLRLFHASSSMTLMPQVRAPHRFRWSVRGKAPWRNKYRPSYLLAQSKSIFSGKHISPQEAQGSLRRLLWQIVLALPLRDLLFSPKRITRMCGRLTGRLP